MNPALMLATTLDRNLSQPTEIVVFGSAALLLDPPFAERLQGRLTNDIDIVIPASREMAVDSDTAFWGAIAATNAELDPQGLYISHIFPDREVVLSQGWQDRVQTIETGFAKLTVQRPDMLDLVLSKMGRGDAQDLADVRNMLRLENAVTGRLLKPEQIAAAAQSANVPGAYIEVFPRARDNILDVCRCEYAALEYKHTREGGGQGDGFADAVFSQLADVRIQRLTEQQTTAEAVKASDAIIAQLGGPDLSGIPLKIHARDFVAGKTDSILPALTGHLERTSLARSIGTDRGKDAGHSIADDR